MDLHLRIDDNLRGVTEIELHEDPDTPSAVWLDCRRVWYEEIGDEARKARRDRTRHALTQEAVALLRRVLPQAHLPGPVRVQTGSG